MLLINTLTFLNDSIYKVINDTLPIINKVNLVSSENKGISADTWVAIIALCFSIIIAIISFFYNRKTLDIQIKHNKLSVLPVLSFTYGYKDKKHFLELKNNGSGVAIIKELTFTFNGIIYNNFGEIIINYIGEENYRKLVDIEQSNGYSAINEKDPSSLAAGQNILIWNLFIQKMNFNTSRKLFLEIYKNTLVTVRYESIYEKLPPLTTNPELEEFLRLKE